MKNDVIELAPSVSTSYQYEKEWKYLLTKLGYSESFYLKVVKAYRFMVHSDSTAFNYFRFGRLFYRLELEIARNKTLWEPGELVRMVNTFDRLQEYNLPKSYVQTELFDL